MKLAMLALLIHPLIIFRPYRHFSRPQTGHQVSEHSSRAWFLRDSLRVQFGLGQQRLRI